MIRLRLETRLELTVGLLLFSLVAASLIFMSWPFTRGLALGGLISYLNFLFLKRDLKSFFTTGRVRGKLGLIFRFYVRLALIAIALYYIISRELADIFGLLIGLSVVMIGLTLGVLRERNLLFAGDGRENEIKKEGKD